MLWWAAFYGNTRIPEIESKDATKKKTLVLNLVYAFNLSSIFVDCVVYSGILIYVLRILSLKEIVDTLNRRKVIENKPYSNHYQGLVNLSSASGTCNRE